MSRLRVRGATLLGIRLLTVARLFVRRLNSLLHTKQWGYQMEGWLNAFKEGGWLPSWSAPGDRGAMTGNMQDASIADAIVKRIPGFNVSQAYAAIRQDAFTVPQGNFGRAGLGPYLEHGYIPAGAAGADQRLWWWRRIRMSA